MKSRPLRILFGAAGFGMIGLICCFLLLLALAGPDTAIRWWYAGYWPSFAIGLPICVRYMK